MRFFNFGESLNQKTLRGKMKETALNLLTPYGIHCQIFLRNASPAILYEEALKTSESLPLLNSSTTYGGAMSISGSMKTLF